MPVAYGAETTPLAVTSTTVPVRLTAAKHPNEEGSDQAVITVEGGPIRFFCHPTASADVSSTAGHPCYDGDEITLEQAEIDNFACVKSTGTNATLQVTYRRGE